MKNIVSFIKTHKYIFIFLLILVCYIPYLLNFYPGNVISDTYSQMKQAMGLKPIDNHHPVFQTFTWWIFINIAKIFHNDNIAVFLNSLFQIISMAGIFTYSIYILDKQKIENKFLPIFYCLYPIYGLYSIYTTKDTMFGVSILFYIIELTKLIDNPKKVLNNKKNIILLLMSMILVILYKNNGIYIVVSTQLIILFYFKKEYFKKLGIIFFLVICFYLLWTNVVFSIFNVKPTEKVESLDLFLNQMYYITYVKQDNLPKEYEKRIDKFIDTELFKYTYRATSIDDVKGYFNTEYYEKNTFNFFKLHMDLFLKYPKESIKSFYLKNQQYFDFFTSYRTIKFYENNENMLPLNIKYYAFKNSYINKMYEIINFQKRDSKILTMLIVLLFNSTTNYYCLIIILLFTIVKRKKEFILLIPLFVLWLTAFVAPNTVFRYIFPSFMCLPFIIYYILGRKKEKNMKKNIMLFIGYLANGGAEHSIINLANTLEKYYNVIMVVASKRGIDYKCNIEILEVPELKKGHNRFKGVLKVRNIKKKYKIDATISYTTLYNFYNTASRYKDETIISIRNHLSTKNESKRDKILHKISLKLANKIVCCSNSVKYDQINYFKANSKKIYVIENFCDFEGIQKCMNKKIKKSEQKYITDNVVIATARLVKHKNHAHIINAFKEVIKKVPDAKLLIFGRGPLKEELTNQINKLNLENNVYLMDFRVDYYNFMKYAKAFVLASDFEGFPNVLIEALACRVPIIATDAPGGSKEILSDNYYQDKGLERLTKEKYGILIPKFNSEDKQNEKDLAKAIIMLLTNEKLNHEYKEKEKIRINDFSKDKIIKKWLDIIER